MAQNQTICLITLYFQGSDFWVPAKKYVGDGGFPEKICQMDLSQITTESIDLVSANYLTHPEWDPVTAGKSILLAELVGKWIVCIKDYHIKRVSLVELFEELTNVTEEYSKENEIATEKWKNLEIDEQNLEQMKEDLDKMEHERSQINQDKIACKDKLEKGRKLIDELSTESQSWKKDLSTISDDLEHLLGNVLVYSASVCLLPAFHAVER